MKSVNTVVLASLVASASAFAPAAQKSASSTALRAEMSESVPFLTKPKNLDGYIGNAGFDPLSFGENFDMMWMAEAEIKNGRVAMLATVGFVTQQFFTLPGFEHVDDSNLAPTVVGIAPMMQIVFGVGLLEYWTNRGNITMETMFKDGKRTPGDVGFDPLGYKLGDKKEYEKLQLNEIKNGRLAMLAIGGMIHHNWVTGEPLL